MKMIPPVVITPAMLHSTNVAEVMTYDPAHTYSAGEQVEIASSHQAYVSATDSNQGNDPTTDNGSNWLLTGSTNRWKAFDQKIGQSVQNPGSIQYQLNITTRVTAVGLLGVAGSSVRVRLVDPASGATIHDETRVASDRIDIIDIASYFSWVPQYETDFVFSALPGFAGNRVIIDVIAGSGVAQVGQIIVGQMITLGVPLAGGRLGIEDYSNIETDDFGNTGVIERPYEDIMDMEFSIPVVPGKRLERNLRRRLAAQRAKPTLYLAGEDLIDAGTLVYGLFENLSIPLEAAGVAICSMEIKGISVA